jgi:RES domain-containing protein
LKAYRVADTRHPLFDGAGAAQFPGRWNGPGQRTIYAAQCLSGALLEVLVHLSRRKLPRTHGYIEIEWPDDLAVERVDVAQLAEWKAADAAAARAFGAAWYAERRSAVLSVPSVVVPDNNEYNFVINQDHPEFRRVTASGVRPIAWDERLFG